MKGTPAEGAIPRLFKGSMKNYIKCINVDFESAVTEDFYGDSARRPVYSEADFQTSNSPSRESRT